MPKLDTIRGIDSASRELLEVAGWTDSRDLAAADPAKLRSELVRANEVFAVAESIPGLDEIAGWIEQAQGRDSGTRGGVGSDSPALATDASASGPVDYEGDPDVQDMLARAPLAIPIPNRILADRGIRPSEIVIAPVLNRATSDLEVRVTARPRKRAPVAGSVGSMRRGPVGVVQVADFAPPAARKIDNERVRTLDDVRNGAVPEVAKPKRVTENERLNLLKSPREETNRGRNPNSRFFIRGVLHDRPYLVWFGCLVVLLFQIMVPLSIVAAPLLFLSDSDPERFGWVPKWFLAFPLSLPLLGLLYFMFSTGVKCRVCGQKLLMPRHCRKNNKAHHVPGLGYVMPTAFHTLVFRWFNCTFCGTSVRIKE